MAGLIGVSGCAQMGTLSSISAPSMPSLSADATPAPSTNVCQVVVQWAKNVHYEPDPINGGVPRPGIVGRIYLFGPTIDYPQVGDGSLMIDLFLDSESKPGEQPVERWCIDPETLHRLLRKDMVGWGYTLFLPWTTYKRDIANVHMTVRYDPRNGGNPLYAPSSKVTLEHPVSPISPTVANMPAASPPAAPPAQSSPKAPH
jgi:hypothetical protein